MDKSPELWDNESVKTPYNLTTQNAFAQPHEAQKEPEKQLNDLIPIPDKTNFLTLLKQSLVENRFFSYKAHPTGRTFYVSQDTVETMIYVLEGIGPHYQDILLDLLPEYMTTLGCKCWEMRDNKEKYDDWFKYIDLLPKFSPDLSRVLHSL